MKIIHLFIFILIMAVSIYGQTGDTLRLEFPFIIDPTEKNIKYEKAEYPEYEAIDFRFYNYKYLVIDDSVFIGNYEIQFHYEKRSELSSYKNGKYYFNGIRIAVYRYYYKSFFRNINQKIFHNTLNFTQSSYNQVPDTRNKLLYTFDEDEGYIFIEKLSK